MLDSSQNNHLIQALAGFPASINTCVETMPVAILEWQPDQSKWSIKMVLAHLLHCEPLFQKRLKRIQAESYPTLANFGPKSAPPVSSRPFASLLEDFALARKQTLSQIYTYSRQEWQRPAFHGMRGETTLRGEIQQMANHDTVHLGQIVDLREMWCNRENHGEELSR